MKTDKLKNTERLKLLRVGVGVNQATGILTCSTDLSKPVDELKYSSNFSLNMESLKT